MAIIFGYSAEKPAISFKEFIAALAIFNSSKLRDQKMKVAFRIQDMDDDGTHSLILAHTHLLMRISLILGVISKADLKAYIQRCTEKDADEEEGCHISSLTLLLSYSLTHLLTHSLIDDSAHPEKNDFDDEKIDEIVGHVFDECSADGDNITFIDFQRIVGPTDYNTKLFLNI